MAKADSHWQEAERGGSLRYYWGIPTGALSQGEPLKLYRVRDREDLGLWKIFWWPCGGGQGRSKTRGAGERLLGDPGDSRLGPGDSGDNRTRRKGEKEKDERGALTSSPSLRAILLTSLCSGVSAIFQSVSRRIGVGIYHRK